MRDLHRTRLAIALGVLALGACAPMTVNQASEEAAIRAADNDYQTAFNATTRIDSSRSTRPTHS